MQNIGILFSFIFSFLFYTLSANTLERIEPPFWWANMNNPDLQIMLYGKAIGNYNPVIEDEMVTLTAIHKVENPNYLFIDVTISNKRSAGNFEIQLMDGDIEIENISYELKARKENSANRKGFDNTDVIYLITPDRFANGNPDNDEIAGLKEGLNRSQEYGRHGGDIQGIADHLSYIKDLGFSSIWLNPVLINDQPQWSYHGYATTDYYMVDPRFGSNEEYVALSKKASKLGMKMIMDIIVNHCGSEHWWMNDLPSKDWVHYSNEEYQGTNHRKYTLVDPYASKKDRELMVKGWFVPAMPDLNQKNPFMSTYLIQNTIWWIEYADLAGIRQDTYSYPYRDFMTDWTCAIMDEYPNFNIVGEEWVDDASIISYWQQGKVNQDGYTSCLPSVMDFPMNMSLHKALKEEESWNNGWVKLYENLANDYLYADPNNLVIFPDNHDMSRIFTTVNEDYDLFKMAIVYISTIRGIPQFYYGTEILMSNPNSDSHGEIRSDYPGGWADDKVSAFESKGLQSEQIEARNFFTKLMHWRNNTPTIHNGKLTHFAPVEGVYTYFRYDEENTYMIVFNKNGKDVHMSMDRYSELTAGFSSAKEVLTEKTSDISEFLIVEKRSANIYKLNP